MGRRVT